MEATAMLNTNSVWGGTTANISDNWWWQPQTYIPLVQTYYPMYYGLWETDKTGKAMRIIKVLLEKNLMTEPRTIGEFIEIVEKVSVLI